MTKLASNFAPYAPPSNVLNIIRGFRNGEFKWPTYITESAIRGIGVPISGVGRVLQTLEFLRLIDENGKRTDWVDELDRAAIDQYPSVLAIILRQAYGTSLECVDPTNVDRIRVTDEFRRFNPERLRIRMVGLFLALCEEAELAPKGTTRPRGARKGSETVRAPKRIRAIKPENDLSSQPQDKYRSSVASLQAEHWVISSSSLIGDTIRRLPKGRNWSRDERNKWLKAFVGNLDFEITVDEKEAMAS